MARARTQVQEIKLDLLVNLRKVRDSLDMTDPEVEAAMAHVESFCAIAVAVFAKTNPSKIRSEAMTVEIAARLDGRTCLED